jgi:NitT/TauT family transport system ATP-binding protein
LENVTFGLEVMGMEKEDRNKKACEYLEMVGLSTFKNSYPRELSGGMKQRVAIARSLVTDPHVLLMDEPFSSLDFQTTLYMHDKVLEIWGKTKTTILFISHDINEAVYLADKVVVLSKRPAHVMDVIEVDLPRPRKLEMTESEEFLL